MAHHNDLIGHNTSPDRNNQIPHAAEPIRKALVTRESTINGAAGKIVYNGACPINPLSGGGW